MPQQNTSVDKNSKTAAEMSTPPTSYTCRICNIPGHWIQQCPQSTSKALPPYNYVCNICGIRGHWIQSCPNRRISNTHNRYYNNHKNWGQRQIQNNITIKHNNQSVMDRPQYMYKLPQSFLNIDKHLEMYYIFMGRNDYNGKFKVHCELNRIEQNVLRNNLYSNDYNGIHLGWDDNFPFIFRVNKTDQLILMHHLIKFLCYNHDSYFQINKSMLWPLAEKIGLRKDKIYHIDLDEYCVDSNDRDLGCKYCANPALYHQYLVVGYNKMHGNQNLFIPTDVIEIISSYFDANSRKLYEIGHRNDYLLSYWKLHRHLDISQHLKFDKMFGPICVNIYQDGTILYHKYDTIMPPRGYKTGRKSKNTLNEEEIETLKILLCKYTKDREWYKYENAPRYECESGCELTQMLRCRIDGKMSNDMVYYDGYNEENSDDQLWVFLNKVCNTIASNACLAQIKFDDSPYKLLR